MMADRHSGPAAMPKRPTSLPGNTTRIRTGCGNAYVTVASDGHYQEVFAILGKSGGCPMAFLQSLTRVITLALNAGVPREAIVKQLRGVRCPQDSCFVPSCPEALAQVLTDSPEAVGEREAENGPGQS